MPQPAHVLGAFFTLVSAALTAWAGVQVYRDWRTVR